MRATVSVHPWRGLTRRLSAWVAFSTTIGLLAYAAIAYVVVIVEEQAEPAESRDEPEEILREARTQVGNSILFAAPLGLLLAVAGSAIAVRRAIRPLDRVIQTAARITARDLHERLAVPETHDEIRAVVLGLNELFERLEAGFAALDRFAADASHELRTPLTVLGTELEVMLQRPRTVQEWEASGRICLDETGRLRMLVSALLTMARVDRAPGTVDDTVDLQTLIERGISATAGQAEMRGVRLVSTPHAETERVLRGDGDSLLSAFISVLGNAVRYTPRGGEVRVGCVTDGLERVVVHVDDNGPGIDASETERIFEPFARGASGRANAESTGLGLTIARRLCEHNAAELKVSRSPLGGARFSFVFEALVVSSEPRSAVGGSV